jgi:N-acetylglucosaminyldiphosphoundecaprenol N-acetyl-beta-D-mannosaminyltransferase
LKTEKVRDNRIDILGLHISNITFDNAIKKVKELGVAHVPSYVCFANVHMTIEAHRDKIFANKVNSSELTLPDGVPVAKAGGILDSKKLERIAGMDFMPALLLDMNKEPDHRYKVFFYGSTTEILNRLVSFTKQHYKNIDVAGFISPPFRPLTDSEVGDHIRIINESGAEVVFVGLGCPKQENWMAANYQRINAVLLGVGGAFLTTAGLQKRAPRFMQKAGLEWFYRLMQEPKRLFKRYFITNTVFIGLLIRAIVKKLIYGRP